MKSIYEAWLGVAYEDTGLYNTQKDAERCYLPTYRIDEMLSDFDGKRVRITIETLDNEEFGIKTL